MDEELTKLSLKERIHNIKPVNGVGENFTHELTTVMTQLDSLGCFDGDPKFLEEFREVIIKEAQNGAEKIGFFGSRANGNHVPHKSDLDVVVINPSVGKKLSSGERIEPASMAGSIKYWGSKSVGMTPEQRIHIQRFMNNHPTGSINPQIVKNAAWIMERGVKPPTPPKRSSLIRF